jgi:glycosyltransferase involved in cell wall biosynthesis
MIPRIAHFVFGLEEQTEPFHFLHYASIESCRRTLEPETIFFHCKHRPFGPWWERVRPHLTIVDVDLVPEVLAAEYSNDLVPPAYRYAHHADFVRLDALIEHGGIYADIDVLFVRPFPEELFARKFVIGAEAPVRDERTGELRPSLCNALLMAEPGSAFAREWRARMGDALDGTWSNHSGFLSEELSRKMPAEVTVLSESAFFHFGSDPRGLAELLLEQRPVPPEVLAVHLWEHLWWRRTRRDFSIANAHWCTPAGLRRARTTLGGLMRPYLPAATDRGAAAPGDWTYLSFDEVSGYGTAADRCREALEVSGLEISWSPFVRGERFGLAYEPAPPLDPFVPGGRPAAGDVVIAHLVPEYLPVVRGLSPEAYLVAHTAWETDRLPSHWRDCLQSADLLVVPSRFCAAVMSAGCPDRPVEVVPHVAPVIRRPVAGFWDAVPADRFVFYTVAEWNERKAVYRTIEAYLDAFTGSDPVVLIVKTSRLAASKPPARSSAGEGTTAFEVARLLSGHRDPARLHLVTRTLDDDQLGALHARGDCFVSLSRGEGWQLGAFDAAAYGNPVVATAFGGHLDYLEGTGYLIDFDLVAVEDRALQSSYTSDQRWAEPHVDHATELLRRVVREHADACAAAAQLGERIRRQYAPEVVASQFRAAVEAGLAAASGAASAAAPAAAPGAGPSAPHRSRTARSDGR